MKGQNKMLQNYGFKIAKWQANEALIIEFAYKVTPAGLIMLGQGDGQGNDPFNAPTIDNLPVSVCFVPTRHCHLYLFDNDPDNDGLGRAFTEAYVEGHGTDLLARNLEAALVSIAQFT